MPVIGSAEVVRSAYMRCWNRPSTISRLGAAAKYTYQAPCRKCSSGAQISADHGPVSGLRQITRGSAWGRSPQRSAARSSMWS